MNKYLALLDGVDDGSIVLQPFTCLAEGKERAKEQALNAYPGATVRQIFELVYDNEDADEGDGAEPRPVPNYMGVPILGSLERVYGVALIVLNDDDMSVEYEGTTDIEWNSQEGCYERGQRIWLTENWEEVPESKVDWAGYKVDLY